MPRELGLKVGVKAPDFELPTESGRMVRLSNLIGLKPVLIYFYPSDFGMMCAVVIRGLKDIYPGLREHCHLLAISCNTQYSHGAWMDALGLPFSLLSDGDCGVTKVYKVYGDDNDYLGDRSYRAYFLVDKKGVIRYAWAPDDPSLEPDYDLLLRATAELDREQ